MTFPEKIHHMRQMLDSIGQAVNMLKPLEFPTPQGLRMANSMEIVTCLQRLDFAKAWLGKILEHLGETSPYGEQPTHLRDAGSSPLGWLEEESHTNRVNEIRKKIGRQLADLEIHWKNRKANTRLMEPAEMNEFESKAWGNVFTYLTEAHMALGWELRRIYEQNR